MPRKFSLGKAPFLRSTDEKIISTKQMMMDVVIALTPIIIFAWLRNGLLPYINHVDGMNFWLMIKPLLFIICGAVFSFLLEGLYFLLFKYYFPNKYAVSPQKWTIKMVIEEVKSSYAIIPGLILALMLPINTPFYVLLFGCFFANIVFKMLFGGFGYNLFNPALIAYAIISVTFWGVISANGGSLNLADIVTGATPLSNFKNAAIVSYDTIVSPYGNLWTFFIGMVPGALGETCGVLCLCAFIYLLVRKVINWRVPVLYVGTVFVITSIIALVNGYGWWYPIFQVLSGGLLFGAVFMATEPVTTPRSPNGKVIFGVALGVFTVLFRLLGSLPGGVGTSILFVGLFSTIIDRFSAKIRTSKTNYKSIMSYVLIGLLFVLIVTFIVIKTKASEV